MPQDVRYDLFRGSISKIGNLLAKFADFWLHAIKGLSPNDNSAHRELCGLNPI